MVVPRAGHWVRRVGAAHCVRHLGPAPQHAADPRPPNPGMAHRPASLPRRSCRHLHGTARRGPGRRQLHALRSRRCPRSPRVRMEARAGRARRDRAVPPDQRGGHLPADAPHAPTLVEGDPPLQLRSVLGRDPSPRDRRDRRLQPRRGSHRRRRRHLSRVPHPREDAQPPCSRWGERPPKRSAREELGVGGANEADDSPFGDDGGSGELAVEQAAGLERIVGCQRRNAVGH